MPEQPNPGYRVNANEAFAAALEAEFRASLITISSAAIALDAFFASVIHHAPDARRAVSRNRPKTLIETFKHAFEIRGSNQEQLVAMLPKIFELRQRAVHPPEDFTAPLSHPVYGYQLERRLVLFRAENATGASSFANAFIWFCLRKPKPCWNALATWCKQSLDLVPEPASEQ